MEYIREDEIPSSVHVQSSTSTPTHSPTPNSPAPFLRHQPFRASNRQQSFISPYSLESPSSPRFPSISRSNPPPPHHERSPLLQRQDSTRSARSARSSRSFAKPNEHSPPRGGIVLGIHNLSIVAPQFLVAIVSAIIFKITSSSSGEDALRSLTRGLVGLIKELPPPDEDPLRSENDVVWVLRFGGLAAIGGAIASRWIIPPRSEREYVKRVLYGHQAELGDEEEDENGRADEEEEGERRRGTEEYP